MIIRLFVCMNLYWLHPYPSNEPFLILYPSLLTPSRHITPVIAGNLDDSQPLKIILAEDKHYINNLKNRVLGPTNITSNMIKHLPNNIISYMTTLFNASISSGYFPTSSKMSNTVLIPKPNKKSQLPNSYRPIGLLEILEKLFEQTINERPWLYPETNNVLPDH